MSDCQKIEARGKQFFYEDSTRDLLRVSKFTKSVRLLIILPRDLNDFEVIKPLYMTSGYSQIFLHDLTLSMECSLDLANDYLGIRVEDGTTSLELL